MAALALAASLCAGFALPASAAEKVSGEVLLTVAPCPPDMDMDEYLDDIAASAGAYVASVYTALSMTEDDPILILIRSETNDSESMAAALADDERVYSATPNRVRLRVPPVTQREKQ